MWRRWLLSLMGLLTACMSSPSSIATVVATLTPSAAAPTVVPITMTRVPTATSTYIPATSTTQPPTPTHNPTGTATPPAVQAADENHIAIDHTDVARFELLSAEAVAAAASLRAMHRASSIGENITRGLDCLWGQFPDRSSRPNFCSAAFDSKYDRSNWFFSLRGNPGWIDKVNDFADQVNTLADDYDVLSFAVDYVDGQDIGTYPVISDPANFETEYVAKLEALEAAYPNKTFVWWTMSLAREGFANEQRFNEMLRIYAQAHEKILFDLADIETHSPDGVRTVNEQGMDVLYAGYTDEERSGHLNSAGRERLARAYWVLLATLAETRP